MAGATVLISEIQGDPLIAAIEEGVQLLWLQLPHGNVDREAVPFGYRFH